MKRLLAFCILPLLCCNPSFAVDSIPKSRERYGFYHHNLCGNIKSIKQSTIKYYININSQECSLESIHPVEYIFNEQGNVAKSIVHWVDTTMREILGLGPKDVSVSEYKYNKHGDIIKETNEYTYDGYIKYKYNKDNQVVRESGNLMCKYVTIYEYDVCGNIIAEHLYYKGENDGKTTYEYDDSGNIIVERHYDSNGVLGSKYTISYNSHGDLIQRLHYNNAGKLEEDINYSYEYDNQGNITEKSYYHCDILVDSETFHYDNFGRIIKKCVYNNKGMLSESISYNYDWCNNIVMKTTIVHGRKVNHIESTFYEIEYM